MASRRQPRQSQGRFAGITRGVRRVWPIALEAWRRWDRLPAHQKERYRKMASDYAQRGRNALNARSQQQRRRPRR